jgi:peptidoglycan/LPS O-acetylase OafA/YrhL
VSAAPTIRPAAPASARLAYRPQLDSLRAFAVTAVVVQHALPSLGKMVPLAHAGVRLFFVLSGFLITGLLLHYRDAVGSSRGGALREFYFRRCLRIWPLYFFVIALALALDAGPVREILPWLLTHTVNFCLAVRGEWVDAFFHFWTLSVEEQFYLLWPLIVLFAPRRWLAPAAVTLVVIGPLYRLVSVSFGWGVFWTYCATPACLDTLGAGSLLALCCHDSRQGEAVDRGLNRFCLPLGLAGVVVLMLLHDHGIRWPQEVLFDLALALVFVWLVRSAARGFGGLAGSMLQAGPVVYLGRISYGVYVYHVLVLYLVVGLCRSWFPEFDLEEAWPFAVALIAFPVLSWHFFEKPINDLKNRAGRDPGLGSALTIRSRRRGYAVLAAFGGVLLAVVVAEGLEYWQGWSNRMFFERRIRDEGSAASGTVYYVSPSGDDGNPGTSPAAAWRTLDRVNRTSFGPGDGILLEGGKTFAGGLRFGRDDAGTPARPIFVGSYGGERATIDAGDGSGIVVRNTMGIEVHDIIVVGSGRETNQGSGIVFENVLPGDIKLPHVQVESVSVSGFGRFGLLIEGRHRQSGFRDVRVAHVEAHDNALGGICVSGRLSRYSAGYAHCNVYVGYSRAHDNPGVAGPIRKHSGSGIVLSDVDGGTIERCVAYQNGRLCNSWAGGPVGIWAWEANDVVIQWNESYRNQAGGPKDGGGFDLDGGVTNSVLQYNYSHENDGPGYLLCQFCGARPFTGNTVRFNVSQNDARKNSYGSIHLHDDNFAQGVRDCHVYHNTVYVNLAEGSIPSALVAQLSAASNVRVRNNILHAAGGLRQVSVRPGQQGLTLQGNDYSSDDGELRILWEDAPYTDLAAWRSATGQERLNETEVGCQVDPKLRAPGRGPTLDDPEVLTSLDAYRLRDDSPLLGAGLDLAGLFEIDPGRIDFFGGVYRRRGLLHIGAHAFGESAKGTE